MQVEITTVDERDKFLAACVNCSWFSESGLSDMEVREHIMSGGGHTVRTVRVSHVMQDWRYVAGEAPDNVVQFPVM